MAGPKRTKTEREESLAKVAELDRNGYSQRVIARMLNVSQQQVCYDLRALRERYAKKQKEEHEAAVAKKLDQYADIRRQCWEAWDRSKKNRERTIAERTSGVGGESGTEKTKAVKTVEGRLPDPQYMRIVKDCLDRECQILGLDAPKKNEVAGPSSSPIKFIQIPADADDQGEDDTLDPDLERAT